MKNHEINLQKKDTSSPSVAGKLANFCFIYFFSVNLVVLVALFCHGMSSHCNICIHTCVSLTKRQTHKVIIETCSAFWYQKVPLLP